MISGELTVGADPEIFLMKDTKYISAQGVIPGTKEQPFPIDDLGKGFFMQADNVACEFNIPPANTFLEFNESIRNTLAFIRKRVSRSKIKVSLSPFAEFDPEILKDPVLQVLGCSPDLNAWTLEDNPSPDGKSPYRTTGGHVHIGWTNSNPRDAIWMARMFDVFVTLPSIMITEPSRRRQMYGAAGACRIKPYGVECRSLDSFWIANKTLRKFVWRGVERAFFNLGDMVLRNLLEDSAEQICDAINSHDKENAKLLVEKFAV